MEKKKKNQNTIHSRICIRNSRHKAVWQKLQYRDSILMCFHVAIGGCSWKNMLGDVGFFLVLPLSFDIRVYFVVFHFYSPRFSFLFCCSALWNGANYTNRIHSHSNRCDLLSSHTSAVTLQIYSYSKQKPPRLKIRSFVFIFQINRKNYIKFIQIHFQPMYISNCRSNLLFLLFLSSANLFSISITLYTSLPLSTWFSI